MDHFTIYVVGTSTKAESYDKAYEVAPGGTVELEANDRSIRYGAWSIEGSGQLISSNNNKTPTAKVKINNNASNDSFVTVSYRTGWLSYDYFYIKVVNSVPKLSLGLNDGTDGVFKSINAGKDGKATIPADIPKRAGYEFVGWSSSATATEADYAVADLPVSIDLDEDAALYAVWNAINATSIAVAPVSSVIERGDTVDLTATVEPADALVKWTSSNSAVASVDDRGRVKGVRNGMVVITASNADGTVTARASVTVATLNTITYNKNGGSLDAPSSSKGQIGQTITLPDYSGTKRGAVFVGWSTDKDATGSGKEHYTVPVYPAGSEYTISGNTTLYATWAATNVDANFFIRLDGEIPTEPQGHNASEYTKGIAVSGAVKIAEFYADSANGVTSRLNGWPSDNQIKSACNNAKLSFDPETQYVLWYVVKHEAAWHVDGVLLEKSLINLSYNANAPAGIWNNMPDGYQFAVGTEVRAGQSGKSTDNIVTPSRSDGYSFIGWNTKADGTGTAYNPGDRFTLNEATTLYAQWVNDNAVTITAPSASKTYDGMSLASGKLSEVVVSGLAEGHYLADVQMTEDSSITDVGTRANTIESYVIKDSAGNDVTSDYTNVSLKPGTLKVTPAAVKVTAVDGSKEFGAEEPPLSYRVNGHAVSGETEAFDGSVEREPGERVGTYAIGQGSLKLADNGAFKASNYELKFVEGEFEIYSSDKMQLTANGYEGVYDAADHYATATASVEGAKVEYSIDGETWSEQAPSIRDVGEQAYSVRATADGYDAKTATVTLKVTPAAVKVTAVDGSKEFGAEEPPLSYRVNGHAVSGETEAFDGSVEREPGERVGTYAIGQGSLKLADNGAFKASNYELKFVEGEFEI
ncbi:MBG domain-containing protein, partial [Eggerthella lenta]|uniref:MBG domain-containing protein n=2 Tax=Eggerthella lenta TaxID=84112 RepID=UPI00189C2EB8